MKKILLDMLTSKKALSAMAGIIVAAVGKIGLDLDTDAVLTLLAPILAYILGQGWADHGKEAVKIQIEENNS